MQTKIQGTTMPVLDVQLEPNESVFSESGELSWMTASIQMTTHTQMGGGGGLFGVLKRVAGGGSLFMTEYRAYGAPGVVSFATKVPGHIVPVEVGPGAEYMVHRHGFLCATPQVTIGVGFQQSLGAGVFGGEGFILQKLTGPGMTYAELDGDAVEYSLKAGRSRWGKDIMRENMNDRGIVPLELHRYPTGQLHPRHARHFVIISMLPLKAAVAYRFRAGLCRQLLY